MKVTKARKKERWFQTGEDMICEAKTLVYDAFASGGSSKWKLLAGKGTGIAVVLDWLMTLLSRFDG